VPKKGLEPIRAFAHYALNVARLPIPPLRLGAHQYTSAAEWLATGAPGPAWARVAAETAMNIETLLVTGGNGLLGTKLLELCLGTGGLRPVSASRNPRSNGFLGPLDFHQVDLAERAATEALLEAVRPRLVVHTAAMTDVDGCERQPEAAWRANVVAAEHVARACRAVDAHLVHLSTEYVFDGTRGPYSEDDRPNPISVYGRSKHAGEAAVGEHLPDAAIARTTVLYGHAPNVRPNFVTWLVGRLRGGTPASVVDDQVGSPTLADNLAEMCLALARGRARGIYNTVGADVIDRHAFALLVAEVFALDSSLIRPVTTASLAQAAPRPLRAGLTVDKLRRDFPDVSVLGARAGLERLREQLAATTETRPERKE
jgi:dTDP-4-dehydrorhamnose reductase